MKKCLLLLFVTLIVNVIQAQPCPSTSSFSVTPPSCFGLSNGCIEINYTAGTAPYTVTWSNSLPQTTSSALSQSVCGVGAGSYNVLITDGNNCSTPVNVNVIEPLPIISSYNSSPATCGHANGSATLTISGGTPNYSVVWNTLPTQVGTVATNLLGGSVYSVSVNDLNGCSVSQTISIANPPFPVITGFTSTSPSCFGLSNSVVSVNYSAGTPPYSVTWSSPISQTFYTTALTQSVSGISSGVYSATVTDAYGCSSSQLTNISQPSLLVFIVSPNDSICNGQSSQIYASGIGGTPPYTYSWSPIAFVGGGPHLVSPSTTTNYTVAISDVNGCSTSIKMVTVKVNLCTNIDEFKNNSTISLYPNPTNELLHITSDEKIQKLEVTNITGQVLFSESVNDKTFQLQLQNFTEGIYFVKLLYANGMSLTKKVVKQN